MLFKRFCFGFVRVKKTSAFLMPRNMLLKKRNEQKEKEKVKETKENNEISDEIFKEFEKSDETEIENKTDFDINNEDIWQIEKSENINKNANGNGNNNGQYFLFNKNKKRDGDDIHSQRYSAVMRLQGEEAYVSQTRKFTLDNPNDAIPINLDDINLINIENEETFHRVPTLAHNLESVVFKPGLYQMDEIAKLQKDGGKYLKKIHDPDEIDVRKIPSYIPPSRDELLLKFAREAKIKYVMSTSTISNFLSQIYYLFSSFKNPNFLNISKDYDLEPKKYMISQRKPTTNFLRVIDEKHNIYALDNDPGIFTHENIILLELGKSIERFLTLPAEKFQKILLKNKDNNEQCEDELDLDHHRFMKLNNEICLRSQIDCRSIDPKTGKPFVFEIKTRACCPIRYDLENYQDYLDYKILKYRGLHSSFEREYFDLIRGAFLKYAFQLRIGRMDGAFIAYHNTKEIFGFEYVKTSEIERRVFGSVHYGEVTFMLCSKVLTVILDNILNDLKKEKYGMVKIGAYACNNLKKMILFVELFPQTFKWGEEKLIPRSEEIKDEYDYFTKYTKLDNKVYKYEFSLYCYINGVLQKNSFFNFQINDKIELKYKFLKVGRIHFNDYMNFLHDAYKFDSLNLDVSYSGVWTK